MVAAAGSPLPNSSRLLRPRLQVALCHLRKDVSLTSCPCPPQAPLFNSSSPVPLSGIFRLTLFPMGCLPSSCNRSLAGPQGLA